MANELPVFATDLASTSGYTFGYDAGQQSRATPIVVGIGGTVLSKINARIAVIGSPTDNVVCKVYSADSTNWLPDTLLATSDELTCPDNDASYDFIFSGDNKIDLVEGEYYYVAWERTGDYDTSNYYQVDYQSGCNQLPGYGIVLLDDGVWTNSIETSILCCTVYGEHDSKFNILDISGAQGFFYTDYYDVFSSTTTWGIGQKFQTPAAPTGGAIKVQHVGFGHGQVSVESPPANFVRCEFHRTDLGNVDFSEVSSTRIGEPSDWEELNLPYDKSDAYYHHQTFRNFKWAFGSEPQLTEETDYYCIVVCSGTTGARWRIGENDDDLLSGYLAYYFRQDGTPVSTGTGETLQCLIINGYELAEINSDKIIPWTIIDLDSFPVDQDFDLRWMLSLDVGQDNILKWNIKEEWLWELLWDLRMEIGNDDILKWKILHEAQQDLILRWNILVEQDWILPWTLRPWLQTDWVLKYGITMSTDTILKWGMNSTITNDFVFRWIIDSRVWQDIALKYHIKVEADHILLIPLRSRIDKDFALKYHLLGNVASDQIFRFNLREFNQVDADNKLRWVLQGKPRIYKITFE